MGSLNIDTEYLPCNVERSVVKRHLWFTQIEIVVKNLVKGTKYWTISCLMNGQYALTHVSF